MVRKPKRRKPRDPTWRLRHALGHRAVANPKRYRRSAHRATEREAREDAKDGREGSES